MSVDSDRIVRRQARKYVLLDRFNDVWQQQVAEGHIPVLECKGSYLSLPETGGRRGAARVWDLKQQGLVEYSHQFIDDTRDETVWRIEPGPKHPFTLTGSFDA